VSSLIEAYYYLFLKSNNVKFEYDKRYCDKNRLRFDFYIPEIRTYIEVTSFAKNNRFINDSFYSEYLKKIERKKKIVTDCGENFEFIQRRLTKEEKRFVKEYMV
jgi:hypothetical protein